MDLASLGAAPYLRPLPDAIVALYELSLDLRWSWSHATDRLWEQIDAEGWSRTANPWLIVQGASQRHLEALARDASFVAELGRLSAVRNQYLRCSTWCDQTRPDVQHRTVAYFSMEYGIADALPIYSGGLGVLAGDLLKTASDLGVPIVAVGLLYQEGNFRQMLDRNGWQLEFYPVNVPSSLPVTLVRDADGARLSVGVELPGRILRLQVWRAQVGRVSLYLLDSNDPLNSPADRGVTSQLYGGGLENRLLQEIVLGIGGWRTLVALGLRPDVCHLNEGHAALVTIERARQFMEQHHLGFWEALWATRAGNVFTTHTPVASAFDVFPVSLLAKYARDYAPKLGVAPEEILALGRRHAADDAEPFNMAYLAARTCFSVNGVSRLHGEMSRRIFGSLYPRWPQREIPVTHITNGVHVPSWDSPWADKLWTEACGKERWLGAVEQLAQAIDAQSDEALWRVRAEERQDLVQYARRRLAQQLAQQGATAEVLARAADVLDPNALTLGFARRFTEYKRPNLLLADPKRMARLLNDPARPVQLLIAGKAHPRDELGKRFIQAWRTFVRRPDVRAHAVFLEDYDIALAQQLVQGVDLWLNTPRRPWEASGTSGMKILVNGGLNLSELDGWWAEGYASDLGWAIGDGREHNADPRYDAEEAEQLYSLLEQEVVPAFYARDASGIPRAWIARMRQSMSRLAPAFSSNRMLMEYVEDVYCPAANAFEARTARDGELARTLAAWESRLRRRWHEAHLANLNVAATTNGWSFSVHAYLGGIGADDVRVQIYADPAESEPAVVQSMDRLEALPGITNGFLYSTCVASTRPAAHFTPRVVPYHPAARVPGECNLVLWWRSAL
jgi:starch phosphorylase